MAKTYDYRAGVLQLQDMVDGLDNFEAREVISDVWGDPHAHGNAGALFQHCTPNGAPDARYRDEMCSGCLTQVKRGLLCSTRYVAADPELTAAIMADDRIPTSDQGIDPYDLDWAVEWQEKMDEMWKDRNPEV